MVRRVCGGLRWWRRATRQWRIVVVVVVEVRVVRCRRRSAVTVVRVRHWRTRCGKWCKRERAKGYLRLV